jgi:hypothetical protein
MATETDPVTAELAKICAITDAATQGPWEHLLDNEVTYGYRREGSKHIATWIATAGEGDEDISEEEDDANADFIAAARSYVPVLLAAVEAVLALHQPGPFVLLGALCKDHAVCRDFSITSNEADRVRACPDCSATVRVSCTCGYPDIERCPHREAITAKLLSEEGE